jgi:hypothetical protein
MWFVRWKGRSDGCDGSDGGDCFFGVLFFPVSFPVFLSRFSTFRSKVLMKGGGICHGRVTARGASDS